MSFKESSAVKRSQAQLGTNRPHTHPPITTELMRVLKRAWEIQGASFNSIMLWAAVCTCFFGFLRSGEATVPTLSGYDPEVHLSLSDVALDSHDSPQMVLIRIKASKTDPFRLGVTVCLGKTNQEPFVGQHQDPCFIFKMASPSQEAL